jgi:hypothetical protein
MMLAMNAAQLRWSGSGHGFPLPTAADQMIGLAAICT